MLGDAQFLAHLPSTDISRSKNFYMERLGLKLESETEGHISLDANGTSLLVYVRPEPTKAEHTAAGWVVPDIDVAVKGLSERGITFERYPGFDQDDMGIARSEEGGGPQIAWFKDPDGNIISVMQNPA